MATYDEEQLFELEEAYTTLVQAIRQRCLMAFGGPLRPGARKKTVRTAVETFELTHLSEFRGVQPDGSFDVGKNVLGGPAYNAAKSFILVEPEDLNRSYPSPSGGWFGLEYLPDDLFYLVPPMGFRDQNALTQVRFAAADPGAKRKTGDPTSELAIPKRGWPREIDASYLSLGEPSDSPERLGKIPLKYVSPAMTRVPPYAKSREEFDEILDYYIEYLGELGYSDLPDYDLRSVAKNKSTWATVAVIGAVVQVVGTLLKLVPVPVVQAVGQALEIAGQITVFVAQAALQGEIFDSDNVVDILADTAYVSVQAYSLYVDPEGTIAENYTSEEVQAVLTDLQAAADEYAAGGDPTAWLAVFPDDELLQASAASWLQCLSPNPAIANQNANAIRLGTGNYALTGSKLGAVPDAPALVLGTTETGERIPLPALGNFMLPREDQGAGMNLGAPGPAVGKSEEGGLGLLAAAAAAAWFLI